MSAKLNSIINTMRAEADDLRAKLAEMDAAIAAVVKVQGGTVTAIKRRGRQPKAANGGDPVPNTAEARDAALKAFM